MFKEVKCLVEKYFDLTNAKIYSSRNWPDSDGKRFNILFGSNRKYQIAALDGKITLIEDGRDDLSADIYEDNLLYGIENWLKELKMMEVLDK